ncbi:MAG: hypothetical protein CML22_06985 [Rheinheimera sp.]|nr:hypothetical protein [Rheinheimera sp.]MBM34028.1 hypothetical protein [Rheinheimera sp.]|tara:strand:+ start:7991 stop:8287 length:297 start_codon:yes stop_codon:yes gene_type:complete
MIYDPVQQMFQRKEENRNSNLIRNKLQLTARNLAQKGYRLYSSGDRASVGEVHQLIGEINGYIELRKSLTPYVAQDGYSAELKRCIVKLTSLLEDQHG